MRLFHRLFTCPPQRIFTPTTLLSLCAILALLGVTTESAFAWRVDNNTQYDIRVRIADMEGGSTKCGNWDDESGIKIKAGETGNKGYDDKDCNPTKKRESTLSMVVVIDNEGKGFVSGEGRFTCKVAMRGAGYLDVYEQQRPGFSGSSVTPNVYCAARFNEDKDSDSPNCNGAGDVDITGDGKCYDVPVDWSDPYTEAESPANVPAMTPANRDVRFLATGDPQYWNSRIDGNDNNYGVNETADAVMAKMKALLQSELTSPPEEMIRGIIVSGDLTQNAREDEHDQYVASITGIQKYVFEGLGNHDINVTGSTSNPKNRRNYTGKKARNTFPTKRPDPDTDRFPHYSWDWHDVHFVQLDLFPGDDPPGSGYSGEDLDPRKALAFLKDDLGDNVGSSGRPVVLIHHYGFDSFSAVWWTDAQRKAYWNAIKNYNVIAIITGHSHLSSSSTDWEQDFDKPSGADNRPDGKTSIPGAARGPTSCDALTNACFNGAFLDITINACNQFIVTRKDDQGTPVPGDPTYYPNPRVIDFTTDGWGSKNPDCEVDAKCKADFTVAADSTCTASASIDAGSTGVCTQTPAGPYGLGTKTVTLDCESLLNVTDSCTTDVTVEDRTKPTIPLAIFLPVIECGIPLSYTTFPPLDNCPNPTLSCTPENSTPAILGNNNVTCTATDGANNQSTFPFVEVGVDTQFPVLQTPAPDVTAECTGERTIFTDVPLTPVATDLCDADLWINSNAPERYPLGATTVTWTITDDSNHEISTSNTVTLVDTTKPVITLTGDNPDLWECGAGPYVDPGFTVNDTCDPDPQSNASGAVAARTLGEYTRTYKAQDKAQPVSNKTEVTRSVIVQDTLDPVVLTPPPDVTAECTGVRTIFTDVPLTPPVVTDQCDTDLWINSNAPETYPLGASTVTWTITDDSNHQTTISHTVTLVDTTAPTITLNAGPSDLECNVDTYTEPGASASDVCDTDVPVSISGNVDTTTVGAYAITYNAQDDSNNAATPQTRNITVQDITPPVITCPADIAVDPESSAGTVVSFNATATDICDAAPTVECPDSGNTFGVGTETVVTCTATDASSNQTPCSLTVKVFSEEEVVNNLQDEIVDLTDNGVIDEGQANSLLASLNNILGQIAASRTNSACGQLQGFVSMVDGWIAADILTEAEAQSLLTSVNNLQATLTCL